MIAGLLNPSILVTFETKFKHQCVNGMLDLDQFLPYRLSLLSNQISRGIAQTYEEKFGLSVTEWRVIAILGRFPGISATEVTEKSAMDKVAVSRAVRRLIDAGRIRRQANDNDRRAKHLYLSPEGQAVYDAIVPAALAYEQRLLDALSDGEREQLDHLVMRLLGLTQDGV
jgi:DNA-binding MarR family transcriptional regulator